MHHCKHIFHTAALTALFLLLCAGTASAASYGAGTVTGDGLRLRTEPGTDAGILLTVDSGTRVVVLENAVNDWYKVFCQAKEGYMSADYVDVSTKLDADLGSGKVQTSGDSLNVRSGPGTGYDRVASLSNGTVVKLTGIDSGWYKIEYRGTTGYVSSDYVTPCAPETASSSASGSSSGTATDSSGGQIGNGKSTAAGEELVSYAAQFLGTPYVYGGNGPNSFDCSGFVKYVYSHFGYSINRTASTQLNNGTAVSKDQLQPGDIVFFRNKNDSHAASHVGIYVGGETFIHASSDTRVVEYSSLVTSNNAKKYIAARRIL